MRWIFLGFLFDKTGQPYYFPLSLVAIFGGVIYGIFLYKKDYSKKTILLYITLSRVFVVLFCNIVLNSYLVYTGFVNKDFNIFSSLDLRAFCIWISPRIAKNVILLPIDAVILCIVIPVAMTAYNQIKRTYAH